MKLQFAPTAPSSVRGEQRTISHGQWIMMVVIPLAQFHHQLLVRASKALLRNEATVSDAFAVWIISHG